jgi:ketosteroid isomerase-like protein
MATAEQVRAAVDGYAQSFVTADKDRFLSVLAPDVVQEEPAGSSPNKGVAALGAFWDSLWPSLEAIEFESRELYVVGDEAALVFTIVQHPKAGGRVTIDGVDTFRVDDHGRISYIRGFGSVREST